jgi:hypothetical protein
MIIRLRVEPLLCNDCKISKYTRATAMEQLGKHIPAATEMHATTEEPLGTVFNMRSLPR